MLVPAGGLLATTLLGFGTLVKAASTIRFTDASFNGIQTGVPFNITWAGDGTVRLSFPAEQHQDTIAHLSNMKPSQ